MIFRNWVLENFPFLEDDFDALTDYELFCKMVEYMKESLEKVKNYQIELDSFNAKLDEFQNYFDNLDVQEEIDNKLDEMAESGELADIIAQYLQLAGVLAFDTISDLENATNVVNGSTCVVLGVDTYNDGKTAFYKVRNITTGDVVDGINIVAIGSTLVGERLPNYYIESKFTKMLTFGDSWTGNELNADGTGTLANPSCNWAQLVADSLGLTLENYAIGGYAIHGGTYNLQTEIERATNNIPVNERENYKYIFVMMGVNDWQGSSNVNDVLTTITNDLNLIKQEFPKSQVIFIPLNYFAEPIDSRAKALYEAFITAGYRCNVSMIPNFYNYLNTFGTYYYKDQSETQPSHPYAHPNDAGHRMIRALVMGCLNGKAYPLDMPMQLDVSTRTNDDVYVNKYTATSNTENFSLNCEITIKSGTTINALSYYELGRFTYASNNVYISRFDTGISNYILPYNDNFAELFQQYQLLVYLMRDGRFRIVSKRQFTASSDIVIELHTTIYRAI